MVRDQVSTVGVRRGGADFLRKSSPFSVGVGSCVVNLKNESPPIDLRGERKKFSLSINMVVLGIKCIAFWKRVKSMKSQ
jgi:hypothetical protein